MSVNLTARNIAFKWTNIIPKTILISKQNLKTNFSIKLSEIIVAKLSTVKVNFKCSLSKAECCTSCQKHFIINIFVNVLKGKGFLSTVVLNILLSTMFQ